MSADFSLICPNIAVTKKLHRKTNRKLKDHLKRIKNLILNLNFKEKEPKNYNKLEAYVLLQVGKTPEIE